MIHSCTVQLNEQTVNYCELLVFVWTIRVCSEDVIAFLRFKILASVQDKEAYLSISFTLLLFDQADLESCQGDVLTITAHKPTKRLY